jgi:ectoine hydroxylase-related dioxygenase (phytanoyl-CoA dioxygenase family)
MWLACSSTRQAGLRLYPGTLGVDFDYFRANETASYQDVTVKDRAALAHIPSDVFEPDRGDVLVFTTDLLHESICNQADAARIAIDFRVVDRELTNDRSLEFAPADLIRGCPAPLPGISNLPSRNALILHPRDPAAAGFLIADYPAP